MPDVDDFDITGNIKAIEKLKSELLAGVSDLYINLLKNNSTTSERSDILSDILILTYILSSRLGIPYHTLDAKALNKLKLGILENDNSLYSDLTTLYKHIEKK